MKKILCTPLLLCHLFAFTQTKRSALNDSLIINKWVKAIVNLEGRYSYNKYQSQLYDSLRNRKINEKQFDSLMNIINQPPYLNAWASGTGIFIQKDSLYYLITAKHVLIDPSENYKDYVFRKLFIRENPTTTQNHYKPITIDKFGNTYLTDDYSLEIRVVNDTHPSGRSFAATSDYEDLIIISLNGCYNGKEVIKGLINKGYKPIDLRDIDTIGKNSSNEEIYSFGFPKESEVIQTKNLPRAMANWESDIETLPFVSKGRFVKNIPKTPFFEAEIFTYHGISGGPIVKNNKLIGITHGFALDTIYNNKILSGYLLYHSLFIKSSLIIPLLSKIESLELYVSPSEKFKR
ncbi:trypsin-like peptidase domain-containing protein [Parafilimonas terrae]|uniref:Trypsin-like peptidase domain-containing protein n=1 Tax=Parafilimonas terrae TaxID=1465490 RepID=A0A1I5ZIG1_9BACT|nr:trypsin-like peptidase domain-containing protein [Parafilimonas terrae]SFQ56225.1 Trypsin-like peptidase domain-containing protein [Parafilimonas terrae]